MNPNFDLPAVTSWSDFIYLFAVLGLTIFLRYIVLSAAYIKFIYDPIKKMAPFRIISTLKSASQRNSEVIYSAISSLIFGLVAVLILLLYQNGKTLLYSDIAKFPIWYLPFSLFLASFLQETYYYWLHRLMHDPRIFKYVHLVHHKSVSTSAWTSFSFHPIEGVLQALIIPIILFIVPLHIYVFLFFMVFMTFSAIINHAGVEIFPSNQKLQWIAKHFIGASHHDQHHRRFSKNFGLYFTFWDRWMGTESKEFMKLFEAHTHPQKIEEIHLEGTKSKMKNRV